MRPKGKAIAILIIAVVLVSIFAGAAIYYNNMTNERNSKEAATQSQISKQNASTAQLKGEISDLKTQLANLTGVIANLTSANLVTSLETHEMQGSASSEMGGYKATPVPFNYLWIDGSVTNEGKGYAVDAGLQVVAYAADGTMEINLTVPFTGTTFGSDNATNAFVTKTYGDSSFALQILDSGQRTNVGINIFHEGSVVNWTITPVCWAYNVGNAVPDKNQPLSSQVTYLQNQTANLQATIKGLSEANIVASINAKAYPANNQPAGFENSLYIVGSLTNTGEGVAYNVGLRVVAYTADGNLEMNITVPADSGTFTYDAATYPASPKLSTINSGYGFDSYSSSNTAQIGTIIYTPDFVSNCTVTPIWTNTP